MLGASAGPIWTMKHFADEDVVYLNDTSDDDSIYNLPKRCWPSGESSFSHLFSPCSSLRPPRKKDTAALRHSPVRVLLNCRTITSRLCMLVILMCVGGPILREA